MTLDDDFRRELDDLSACDRLRETKSFGGTDRAHPTAVDGTTLLSFCSNDYLGLAGHPDLAKAAATESATSGFGSSASRLVSGEGPSHQSLERSLASLVRLPSALVFPTGYQANIGVLTAVAGPLDLIVSDAANHASIIDGCRLSKAKILVYPHLDAVAAAAALMTPGAFRRRFLVTESLFSMDGDRAPLTALAAVAAENEAGLIVDEAHALGTIGARGCGLSADLGIRPAALIGTLGKSFGALGGFAAGSLPLRGILVNKSRSFIYSTGSPPPLAAAAQRAVELAAGTLGDERRQRARAVANHIRLGLGRFGTPSTSQDLIIPIILGSERRSLQVAEGLLQRNILVPAIRPPTVPQGTARLRITVSAAHTPADAQRLVEALADLLTQLRD